MKKVKKFDPTKKLFFTSKQLEILKILVAKEIFCVEDDINWLDDNMTEQELKYLLTQLTSICQK